MTDAATRMSNWRHKYPGRTPLNERTTARYDRCVEAGGHIPSGQTVTRYFPGGDRTIPICSKCRVPFGGPKIGWTTNPMGRAYTR